MANTTISASVRYLSDGKGCIWPVPFPFGAASSLGVALLGNGTERSLEYGLDYLVQDNCVMCVVPEGQTISIWLKTDQQTALTRAVAPAALTAAPQAMSASAEDAAIEETVSAGLARLQQQANELSAMLTQLFNSEAERVRLQLQAEIAAGQSQALQRISTAARDGKNELSGKGASIEGNLYAIERDAIAALEEKGRMHADTMAIKANAVQKLVEDAQGIRDDVADRANWIGEISGNISKTASLASADLGIAKDAAREAWQAAWQASCMANRPGIGAIGKLAELDKCGSGMFVINGRITHTPTMFFGLWPVACPCCATWDGFFIIGPEFPDDPKLPPWPAEDNGGANGPGSSASVGNGGWGACIHHKEFFENGEKDGQALPVRN